MTRVDEWVDTHGWKIVTGLISVTASVITAWAALNAQITGLETRKADRKEVVATYDSVLTELRAVKVELRFVGTELHQQHSYLCRGKEDQIGCQP